MSTMMAVSRAALGVLVLLAVLSSTTEAATIKTWNGPGCSGDATNEYRGVGLSTCTNFIDQGSVQVTDISADTRVSDHNQKNCQTASMVGQAYGPVCFTQGATKIRSVWVQG